MIGGHVAVSLGDGRDEAGDQHHVEKVCFSQLKKSLSD